MVEHPIDQIPILSHPLNHLQFLVWFWQGRSIEISIISHIAYAQAAFSINTLCSTCIHLFCGDLLCISKRNCSFRQQLVDYNGAAIVHLKWLIHYIYCFLIALTVNKLSYCKTSPLCLNRGSGPNTDTGLLLSMLNVCSLLMWIAGFESYIHKCMTS